MTATLKTHKPQQNGSKPAGAPSSPSVKNGSRAPEPTITRAEVDAVIGEDGSAWERLEAFGRRVLRPEVRADGYV